MKISHTPEAGKLTAIETEIDWQQREQQFQKPESEERNDLKAFREKTRVFKKDQKTLAKEQAEEEKDLLELQKGAWEVLAAKGRQKVVGAQRNPQTEMDPTLRLTPIDTVIKRRKSRTDEKRWKTFEGQPDSKAKRLQALVTDPADLILPSTDSTTRWAKDNLDHISLQYAIVNPELIPDHLCEALLGESLQGLSHSQKLRKKVDCIPLLKKLFQKGKVFSQKKPKMVKGREATVLKPAHRMLIAASDTEGASRDLEGKILFFSGKTEREGTINRPKVIIHDSAYRALRSLTYTLNTLQSDKADMDDVVAGIGGIPESALHLDGTTDTSRERQRVAEAIGTVREKIGRRLQPSVTQAGEQLGKAQGLQDSTGRHNPLVSTARIGSARGKLESRTGALMAAKSHIGTQKELLESSVKYHEINLGKLIQALENHATKPVNNADDLVGLHGLLQTCTGIIRSAFTQDRDGERPMPQPFQTYYGILDRKLKAISALQRTYEITRQKGVTPQELAQVNQEIVKIYSILKIFQAQKAFERILTSVGPEKGHDLDQSLGELQKVLHGAFDRSHYKVQPGTAIPSYDALFGDLRHTMRLGEGYTQVAGLVGKQPEDLKAVAELLKGFDFVKVLKELD